MAAGVLTFSYKRLGRWYPLAFMAVELQTALLIVGGTLALFTFYFDGNTHQYLTVLGIALVLTEAAILTSPWRGSGPMRPVSHWVGVPPPAVAGVGPAPADPRVDRRPPRRAGDRARLGGGSRPADPAAQTRPPDPGRGVGAADLYRRDPDPAPAGAGDLPAARRGRGG